MPLLGRLNHVANPLCVNGTSAAPGNGVAVASIASVPAGKYIAHVYSTVTGSVDEVPAKRANLDLRSSANPAATVGGGFDTKLNGRAYATRPFELTGTSTVSVNAASAATGSTTYDVTLILERIA